MRQPDLSIPPVARLSDQVADALSADIQGGRLAVGDRLPTEAALVERFGVSRAVVREAVSRLKSVGLVHTRQGSGAYVRNLTFAPLNFEAGSSRSKQAVIQMAEVRRALEAEVAALAAQRRNPDSLARIRQAIVAIDAAVQAGRDGSEEDVNFHRAIAAAADNPFLVGTLDYLRQFLHGATRVTRANEARRDDFAREVRDEHEAIARAIEAGDVAAARAAAATHMSNAIRRIEQADPAFWAQEGVALASPLVSATGAATRSKESR